MNFWTKIIAYLSTNSDSYLKLIIEHTKISLISITVSILIAVPIGYLCTRNETLKKWALNSFQVLRIIPSLAILILLIPILGTGVMPATVALVLLGIPPILMNTVTAFTEVPLTIIESATAMGMTDRQVLKQIKFPLAIPIILIGVKTAMVEIIASATIASKIGAGGLGDLIFTGLGLNRMEFVVVGGVTVAFLSLSFGLIIEVIEKRMTTYRSN